MPTPQYEPDELICMCNSVPYSEILAAIKNGAKTLDDIKEKTKACTECGSCEDAIMDILAAEKGS